jgi:fructose 1,6-bisphosphatase
MDEVRLAFAREHLCSGSAVGSDRGPLLAIRNRIIQGAITI